jgi:hypothetical protein
MSAFEQKREIPNRALQYMVVRLSVFLFLPSRLPLYVFRPSLSRTPIFSSLLPTIDGSRQEQILQT